MGDRLTVIEGLDEAVEFFLGLVRDREWDKERSLVVGRDDPQYSACKGHLTAVYYAACALRKYDQGELERLREQGGLHILVPNVVVGCAEHGVIENMHTLVNRGSVTITEDRAEQAYYVASAYQQIQEHEQAAIKLNATELVLDMLRKKGLVGQR